MPVRSRFKWITSILLLTMIILCGSCSFTKKVKSGEEAYALKQYSLAVEMLVDDYNGTNERVIKAEKAFYVGRSMMKMGNTRDAIKWFSIADEFGYGVDATKNLGLAQKGDENYRGAIQSFQKYMDNGGMASEARKEISLCKQAMQWSQAEHKYNIDVVDIPSEGSVYAPVLYQNSFLVYTSDNTESTGDETYLWTGRSFSDLFITSKTQSELMLFDKNLNTQHNEGTACFNVDYSEIFFTKCYQSTGDDYCKIVRSVRQGKSWSRPEEPFYMEKNANYRHPALIENDSVLIFTSDVGDDSGGYDLYYSVLEDGGWSSIEPMPSRINTEGDELFPTANNDTLYFSSDLLPGMGGMDIFKTYLKEGGEWSDPENVQSPINSGADDFSLVFEPTRGNELKGYFSSSRHGDGTDKIYSITKRVNITTPEEVAEEEEPDTPVDVYKAYVAVRVVEAIHEDKTDPNSRIINKKPLRSAKIDIRKEDGSIESKKSNLSGRIVLEVEWESKYRFLASKKGFLNNRKDFETPIYPTDIEEGETYNIEIVLDKIYENTEILLDNIYYEFDKWDITEEAKPSLNTLIELLKDNPQIAIELGSHTDCQGDNDYNLDLSQKRARSAARYIVENGVQAARISSRGYGETRLAVPCDCDTDCTEDQHQINRRTTFKILEN